MARVLKLQHQSFLELTGLISLLSKNLFNDKKQSGEKEYYFISTIKISSIDNPAVSYVFP